MAALLKKATGFRHGLLLPESYITPGLSDIPNIYNAGVPLSVEEQVKSAAGGAGWTKTTAQTAAIAEAIERYVAQTATLPRTPYSSLEKGKTIAPESWSLFSKAQRRKPDFPFNGFYDDDIDYSEAFSLLDNSSKWVPSSLIGLAAAHGQEFITSNGLAAGPSKIHALLRATQELIERDAFMTVWRHGLTLPSYKLPDELTEVVEKLQGRCHVLDITPAFSPHPVMLVYGEVPLRGMRRISIGIACRSTNQEAAEKAYLEWAQGVTFIGVRSSTDILTKLKAPHDVQSFEDHALYYTANPSAWDALPFFKTPKRILSESNARSQPKAQQLEKLVKALHKNDIQLYYRDLSDSEVSQLGVYVVRVMSPQLIGLNADARYPFLGGTASNIALRFPAVTETAFPNMAPHPLG